jgi:hypothetical protein
MTRRARTGARIEIRAVGAPALVRKAVGETLVVYAADPVIAYGIWGEEALVADDSILVDEPEASEIAIAATGDRPARAVLIRLDRT